MNNKPEHTRWIEQAQSDLEWARVDVDGEIYYGACFASQQAAEKALKAYLVLKKPKVRKIHDLKALLKECSDLDSSFEELVSDVEPLTNYYIETRYPDIREFVDFTKEKAEDALQRAEKIVNFVESKISPN